MYRLSSSDGLKDFSRSIGSNKNEREWIKGHRINENTATAANDKMDNEQFDKIRQRIIQ